MSVREWLLGSSVLRRMVLTVLRKLRFDISILHHWVPGYRIKINSYLHKGYWFHGKNREAATMQAFARLIAPADRVVEVGGHVGYISTYFAFVTGPKGHVTVFEPGSNNLPYIRENIRSAIGNQMGRIELVEAAVGSETGTVSFFEDNLTGQNNSVVKNFSGLAANAKNAHVEARVDERIVQLVSLDEFFKSDKINFVKIDVEGFEFSVLSGMKRMISESRPIIMVEIQADQKQIFDFFRLSSYQLVSPDGLVIMSENDLADNIFAIPSEIFDDRLKIFARGH
jgi:FkbM family methyltransferase